MTYETAPSTRLVATHCAACNRPLRDALSVEAGMGPECRKEWGAQEESPAPDWERARAALGEGRDIIDVGPGLAQAWGSSTRKVANLLTERVAAQQGTPLARRCIGAIRALGYERLANRLSERMGGPEKAESKTGATATSASGATHQAPVAPIRVAGRVIRMFHTSPRFSAGKLIVESVDGPSPPGARSSDPTDAGDELSFAGSLAVSPGDRVVLHGTWQRHEKFGLQLSVSSFDVDRKIDREGLALYLAASPAFKGIGPSKAALIARQFGGDDFERVLTETPGVIAAAVRVPVEVIASLRDEWIKNRQTSIVMTQLAVMGLTNRQCELMVEEFSDQAPAVLKDAPYSIIGRIAGLGFKRVDEIARRMEFPREAPARIDAGIVACIAEALDKGDTWVEYRDLLAAAVKLLALDMDEAESLVEKATDALIAANKLHCEAGPPGLIVADPKMWLMEDELRGWMHSDPNPHFAGVDVAKEIARADDQLTPEQIAAGVAAATNTRVVVTGPAGSGKTRLLRAITRLYVNRGKRVVHAAPTGKAAKRIEQALEGDCPSWGTFTLHRLLGYDGSTWAADRQRDDDGENKDDGPTPIERASVVIVDETSMVDVVLAWQLFRVLRPSQAVILVGDHNQLPPVGPGNLLRDLINWSPIPVIRLTTVHRQAGVLLTNCRAVLEGAVPPSAEKDPATGHAPWTVVDRFRDPATVVEAISGIYSNVLEQKLGFHLRNDVQLLTPTWRGPIGAHALNARLQQIIQRRLFKVEVPGIADDRRPPFLRGDRIIQMVNDYDIEVMNGTIGVVIDPAPEGPAAAAAKKAGGKPILCRFLGDATEKIANAEDISLAYALSIHKAQGDQFPCVVSIVHKAHSWQHHRNLLYTAVTRAQSVSIIIGDRWGIENCAKTVETERRHTFLSIVEMAGEERRRTAITPATPTHADDLGLGA